MVILGALAEALDATHASGVVHRDLKPENLFLARGPRGEITLKVLDFGVAKILAESGASLHSTRTLGSPLYMSPEQLEGEATIDGRSDVYAFGHVAFALLVGEAYWESRWRCARGVFPVLLRVMHGAVEPPSTRVAGTTVALPAGFDAWFLRATAREPEDRFDTAGEAFAALSQDHVDDGPVARERDVGRGQTDEGTSIPVDVGLVGSRADAWPRPTSRRRPRWWWAASLVVLGAAASVVAATPDPASSSPAPPPVAPPRSGVEDGPAATPPPPPSSSAGLPPVSAAPVGKDSAPPRAPMAPVVEPRSPPRRRGSGPAAEGVTAQSAATRVVVEPPAPPPSATYDPTDLR
jgi:serine/threonine-protein kinase